MNEAAVQKGLCELREILGKPPAAGQSGRPSVLGLYLPSPASAPSPEDSLDDLRVLAKYVVFDLEATRRENRYLRQMLESRSQPDTRDGPDDDQG